MLPEDVPFHLAAVAWNNSFWWTACEALTGDSPGLLNSDGLPSCSAGCMKGVSMAWVMSSRKPATHAGSTAHAALACPLETAPKSQLALPFRRSASWLSTAADVAFLPTR